MLSAEAVPAFKWGEPDEEGLVEFLVKEKNFNEDRVRTALKKVHATKGKSSQGTLPCHSCRRANATCKTCQIMSVASSLLLGYDSKTCVAVRMHLDCTNAGCQVEEQIA